MVCSLVLCLCLEDVGGVGTNPSLLLLEAPSCFCLNLSLFLLPLTLDLLVVGTSPGVTEPLLAGKLAKLGDAALVPGAFGTGVGVMRGKVDLKVVTVGPRGVVVGATPDGFCFKVCFCNKLFIALQ